MGLTALVAYALVANGQTWTQTSAVSGDWQSVGMSADASTITAVAFSSGPHCTSTNGGMTWSTNTLAYNGQCVASSADGKSLVVVSADYGPNGGIQISTNTGATWNVVTNLFWAGHYRDSRYFDWRSAACSADARTMVVGCIDATGPGQHLVSTNSAEAWTAVRTPGGFALALSADGSRVAAGVEVDGFYSSTNSGLQWVKKSGPAGFCWCLASSADGGKLAAAIATNSNADMGLIYTSPDGGDTWESVGRLRRIGYQSPPLPMGANWQAQPLEAAFLRRRTAGLPGFLTISPWRSGQASPRRPMGQSCAPWCAEAESGQRNQRRRRC